jgi:peptidoglycan-associated lipoprotein
MRGHPARTSLLASGLALATVLLTGCPKTPVVAPDASSGGTSSQTHRQAATTRPPGAPTSSGYVKTATLGDVHFDVDRVTVRPADQRVLDANAAWLKSNAQIRLLLEGFADERGTPAHNQSLGERRAAVVRDTLVARGIEPSRISVRSYGEQRPLCTDQTDACWARNRRVQFLVSQ